jgi:hypothetical protein
MASSGPSASLSLRKGGLGPLKASSQAPHFNPWGKPGMILHVSDTQKWRTEEEKHLFLFMEVKWPPMFLSSSSSGLPSPTSLFS